MYGDEKVLVARRSPFNLILLTENAQGLRSLRFGEEGVCQSVVNVEEAAHLALPYTNVLPLALAFAGLPRRLLVLGLGGGTLPRFFHKILPECKIDVVELDPDVLEIAKDYCGFQEDARMRVYIDDGRGFIAGHSAYYDVLVLDGFGADSIPDHLRTAEFLHSVRCALTETGIAVANVWGRNNNRLYEHMLLTYREVFEEVYVLDVAGPGTRVFVALQHKQTLTHAELLAKMSALPMRPGFNPGQLTFRHSDKERLENGSVLRDSANGLAIAKDKKGHLSPVQAIAEAVQMNPKRSRQAGG